MCKGVKRAKDEIERIADEFKDHKMNIDNNLTNEIQDKLIHKPRQQLYDTLSKIDFINL